MAKNKKNDPDPEDSMTPEEKLFRVISSGGKDFAEAEENPDDLLESDFFERAERIWRHIRSVITEAFVHHVNKYWKTGLKQSGPVQVIAAPLSLKKTNKVLMAVVGVLTFYLFADFSFGKIQYSYSLQSASPPLYRAQDLSGVTQASRYVEQVKRRNVFARPQAPPPVDSNSVTGTAPLLEAGVEEAPKGYKLVGISWQGNDYVAMIEVEGVIGAVFVRKGDEVGEGVAVTEITAAYVKIKQGDKVWELS